MKYRRFGRIGWEVSDQPPLTPEQMARAREIYDTYIRPYVHHRW